MLTRSIRCCVTAVLAAAALGLAGVAGAQRLSLSYDLGVVPDAVQPAPATTASRCAGANWVATLGSCSWDLITRFATGLVAEGEGAQAEPAIRVPARRVAAPSVGGSGATFAGGVDVPAASSRVTDTSVRFSTTNQSRQAEGGREWSRLSDLAQEARRPGSPRTLTVEMVVPFQ